MRLNKKAMWTISVLIIYLLLSEVPLFGLSSESTDYLEPFRNLIGGSFGSLLTLGIFPLIGEIFILEALVANNYIKLDMSNPADEYYFKELSKSSFLIFTVVQAIFFVTFTQIKPNLDLAASLGISDFSMLVLLVAQLVVGAILVEFFIDIINEWGIGNGVGWFIIAGVSISIFFDLFNPKIIDGLPLGTFPRIYSLVLENGLLMKQNELKYFVATSKIIPLVGTIIMFFIYIYIFSIKIEIPLAHSAVRGARGRFPVRLIYASSIPLALVESLRIFLFSFFSFLYNREISIHVVPNWHPLRGNIGVESLPVFFKYLQPLSGASEWIPMLMFNEGDISGLIIKIFINAVFLVGGCVLFSLFWVETRGIGARPTARKIFNSGYQIPGFRRNIGSIEKVMARYIPTVTVWGGIILGLLALISSFFGIVGNDVVGLLIAIQILIKIYKEVENAQTLDLPPRLRNFFFPERTPPENDDVE
ncbi:preprotein translocase subunit SecY [Methanolobus sp. WCC4]|uniref:preprotein translocase subunit SecY n=1 Tax=Methanolobus sp. WCC4 TaxID=3125784 RepID=UPI0030F7A155